MSSCSSCSAAAIFANCFCALLKRPISCATPVSCTGCILVAENNGVPPVSICTVGVCCKGTVAIINPNQLNRNHRLLQNHQHPT